MFKMLLYSVVEFKADLKIFFWWSSIITSAVCVLCFLPLSINHSFRRFHTHTQSELSVLAEVGQSLSHRLTHSPTTSISLLLHISPAWEGESWVGYASLLITWIMKNLMRDHYSLLTHVRSQNTKTQNSSRMRWQNECMFVTVCCVWPTFKHFSDVIVHKHFGIFLLKWAWSEFSVISWNHILSPCRGTRCCSWRRRTDGPPGSSTSSSPQTEHSCNPQRCSCPAHPVYC